MQYKGIMMEYQQAPKLSKFIQMTTVTTLIS